MDMTEKFLMEQSPQYDNFWGSLMSGQMPQRTDVAQTQQQAAVAPPPQAPQQERVPIGYGPEFGPPGSGAPQYADSKPPAILDPEFQQQQAEQNPELFQIGEQTQAAIQANPQQAPQIKQQALQKAKKYMMTSERPEADNNWYDQVLYTPGSISSYNDRVAGQQEAWDEKERRYTLANSLPTNSPYAEGIAQGSDKAEAAYYNSLDGDDNSTNATKNWEYGKNNPGFRQQQAKGGDNYNAKIAQAQYYAGLDPEQQQQARDAWRSQTYLNQGTQFAPTTGQGPAVPIYNQQAASEKAQGAGYGKAQSDYVTGYGAMRDVEDDFISNLRETKALISEAGNNAGITNTGWMSYLDQIPATDARTMTNLVETIQSRVAMDQMMNLKAASPTGSTGFGALSQKELSVLQDYLGKIDTKAKPAVVKRQMRRVFTMMDNMEKRYDKKRERNDKKYNMFLSKAPADTQQLYTPYGAKPAAAGAPPKTVSWKDLP